MVATWSHGRHAIIYKNKIYSGIRMAVQVKASLRPFERYLFMLCVFNYAVFICSSFYIVCCLRESIKETDLRWKLLNTLLKNEIKKIWICCLPTWRLVSLWGRQWLVWVSPRRTRLGLLQTNLQTSYLTGAHSNRVCKVHITTCINLKCEFLKLFCFWYFVSSESGYIKLKLLSVLFCHMI